MDELKVRDIMRTDVVTVGPDATVRELADLLAEHKISGVPVVDEDGRLLGIVTEGDVIIQDADLHFPHYVQFLESIIYLESVRKFEERFKKAFGAKVADVMSTEVSYGRARRVGARGGHPDGGSRGQPGARRRDGPGRRHRHPGDIVRAMALDSTE